RRRQIFWREIVAPRAIRADFCTPGLRAALNFTRPEQEVPLEKAGFHPKKRGPPHPRRNNTLLPPSAFPFPLSTFPFSSLPTSPRKRPPRQLAQLRRLPLPQYPNA